MAADTAVFLSSYLDDKAPTNLCISTLLESLSERQSLQGSGCSKEWISKLNTLLNSNKDRWLGISLLGTTLQQCETEVFTSNCISWMKVIQQILESPTSSLSLIQCSVKLLDDLMRYAVQFPDLMRNLANFSVPAIITSLLSLKDKDTISSLTGVCSSLRYFPGPSSQFKGQIENCLLSCVDENNATVRKHFTQCFALLAASCNSPQNDKQRKNWEIQWSRVVNTVHSTLDMLHEYEKTKGTSDIKDNEVLPVKSIETEEPKKTNTCTARVRALLTCLDAMIREGTRKVTMVPVDDTLTLIERILSVNEKMLKGSVSVDVVLLKSCLALIHLDTVELLCSLMQRCGSILLPNANRIAKMLINVLSWTSEMQSNSTQNDSMRPYSNLRCAVYNCFLYWGQLNASFHPNIIKDVICHILKEITVVRNNQTKLKASSVQQQKGSSKKGKKRKLQEIEQLSTNHEKVDPLCNAKGCHTALTALFSIMMTFGDSMKKETFQEIQVTLLDLVGQFQPGYIPQPYNNPDCRMEVYHCLLACIVALPTGATNAISCVVKFLKEGLQDASFKVSNYCREALTIATALIHPLVPSIEIAACPFVYTNHGKEETLDSNHNKQQQNGSSVHSEIPAISTIQPNALETLDMEKGNTLHIERAAMTVNSRLESSHQKTLETSQNKRRRNPFNMSVDTVKPTQSRSEAILHSNAIQPLEKGGPLYSKRPQSVTAVKPLETQSPSVDNPSTNKQTVELGNIECGDANSDVSSSKDSTSKHQELETEKHDNKLQKTTNDKGVLDPGPTGSSDNYNNEDSAQAVPAKKPKTDKHDGVTMEREASCDARTTNQQDSSQTQEMDDVDDMLASFVNSSPDSDCD